MAVVAQYPVTAMGFAEGRTGNISRANDVHVSGFGARVLLPTVGLGHDRDQPRPPLAKRHVGPMDDHAG